MQHSQQIALLEELLGLKVGKQFFLDEQATASPVSHYHDSQRFAGEQERIFRVTPQILAHSSELAAPDAFLRRELNGRPLLITRAKDGEARVFLNVCRHRGTRLVDDDHGCRQRFSCPYHAWTWDNRGTFIGAPHFEAGFPQIDPESIGLKRLPSVEMHGFLWALPQTEQPAPEAIDLAGLEADLDWVGTGNLIAHDTHEQLWHCNWKLLVEGGLEAYHFRVAHRHTIAKLFNDNLSSYQCFGPHIRSVLPRASITSLASAARDRWHLREHANVLYTLYPTSMLLVQSDHVIWVGLDPRGPTSTRVRIVTLKPRDTEGDDAYWDKNHALTVATLKEDFELAESMQSGMRSEANEFLRFGRFEGALHRFNETVCTALGDDQS